MASNVEIIVKRPKKNKHEGHHGGAWKVAYADFVTAMMAFFLLLWLLNATTEEQKRGISDYFSPASASQSRSGAGGLLGGRAISLPGSQVSGTATPSLNVPLSPSEGSSDQNGSDDQAAAPERTAPKAKKLTDGQPAAETPAEKKEDERFKEAERELRKAMESSPELKAMANNLLVDRTPQGLRIQIIDREGRPMFPLGSAQMLPRTKLLLDKISDVIRKLPNRISITGHTDATPYRGAQKGYGNWELSSDRALASRRVLIAEGLPSDRVAMVVGRADEDPLVPKDPTSPRNRRISIVLLRQAHGKAQASSGGNGTAAATATAAPASQASPAAPSGTRFERDWTGPRLH